MSTSTNPDRPNRLVVALGIATIVLFSANLLSMISQRVWPKLQDMALFGETHQVDETATAFADRVEVHQRHRQPAVYSFHTVKKRKSRCSRDHNHANFDVQLERSLDSDMDRLERDIEREMERLNSDLSGAREDLENSISVKLRIEDGKTIVLDQSKLDLQELEEKIERITRRFELRVREHEAAARSPVRQ